MPAPLRIASFLASGTEIICGLGLQDRLVAISHECDFPAKITDRPRVTFTRLDSHAASGQIDVQVRQLLAEGAPLYEIDVPQITALHPDLIVTQAQCDVCAVKYEDVLTLVRQEPALNATRVVSLNPQSLEDVFRDIERVGQAVDRVSRAREYVDELQARIEAVRSKTAKLSAQERPRVACVEWIEPLMLAANWMPEIIDLAGGVQPFSIAGHHSTYNEWQQVVDFDPQVIVVMPCGFDLARTVIEAQTMARVPGWAGMSAVRAKRVYGVDGNAYFNRSGPRIVDSLEILAHLLHPQLFPEASLQGGSNASCPLRIGPAE
jgi:iron complex transport system substrate-binding protein